MCLFNLCYLLHMQVIEDRKLYKMEIMNDAVVWLAAQLSMIISLTVTDPLF